ncbi:GNAT family N-acetyltransferase [uncultured Dubosiella sp.]|uniref:GNAT family N-acetyltransferase n=1 Tax=uncultured Dubosiella sp. TaxID=1937011 RepID=UPI0027295D3C|nr:GNAT family N-acetyltransferase [uncultured Dubosiella sp.]
MEFVIREYTTYDEQEIVSLYERVGWRAYTKEPERLKRAFSRSLKIYGAYQKKKLVGLIRVVGDGVSVVFIQDLLVDPAAQGKGIGSALLQTILQDYQDVYQIHLVTDHNRKMIRFYQKNGLVKDRDWNGCAFTK